KKKAQTREQRIAMGRYFERHDPYHHPIVIHNGQWPNDLYGVDSPLHGASLQTNNPTFKNVHKSTLNILRGSAKAGKQWIVACDEPGDAQHSLLPDAEDPDHFHARTNALWGVFLAGGWGIEWYFGYEHAHSDLTCQDYRSRDKMWEQSAHALQFFRANRIPVEQMECHDDLLSAENGGFCLAQPGEVYVALVLNPAGPGETKIDLQEHAGPYQVRWFNPRTGGELQAGRLAKTIAGPGQQSIGMPPRDADKDWVALIRRL
ncbi:MAG: DUF5060 domain-containing protein, partial [Bythopirellula sp.]